jgi:SAM-dependent methyltransferase
LGLRDDELGGRIAPWLRRDETVLDLGGGSGSVSGWLGDRVGIVPTLAELKDYPNRRHDMVFIRLPDPLAVPVQDDSFDAVMVVFVLHHLAEAADQEKLIDEAVRISRRRIVIMEDTPGNQLDLALTKGWDWFLNRWMNVPTPFTFRSPASWASSFERRGLSIVRREGYRGTWPIMKMVPQTLFVLDK